MKSKKIVAITCAALVLCFVAGTVFVFRPYYYKNMYVATVPSNMSVAKKAPLEPIYGDFYVSSTGSDSGDGSIERPFATLQKARDTIRLLDKKNLNHIIVAVMAGNYKLEPIEFTSADSGTETCTVIYSAYGDGEVLFSGGTEYSARLNASDTALISVSGAQNIDFSGFTVENFHGDAFRVSGKNIGISACTIHDIAGRGIVANGDTISISACDISHTGLSGIEISGGNRETLAAGNCVADNNIIRNTSEVDISKPSVLLGGVGNVFTNNDVYNIPQAAIHYSGNGNRLEYNYIHNAVLVSNDAAAINSDMRWDCYGNFILYNCISTLGDGAHKPDGIRACSGTQIYGNMLLNIPGTGIDLMGGRDILIENNIVLNAAVALSCRSVAADFNQTNPAWKLLTESPYQTAAWKEAYPNCTRLIADSTQKIDPMFVANPANSRISNNIVLSADKEIGIFADDAKKFSRIENNAVFSLGSRGIFEDAKGGNYILAKNSSAREKVEEFTDIPFDTIGRY